MTRGNVMQSCVCQIDLEPDLLPSRRILTQPFAIFNVEDHYWVMPTSAILSHQTAAPIEPSLSRDISRGAFVRRACIMAKAHRRAARTQNTWILRYRLEACLRRVRLFYNI